MPMTAIILAAGEGKRMKSHHSKVMHKLLDKPLIWWTAQAAQQAGATHIIIVVGHKGEEIRSYFDKINFKDQVQQLTFVEQREQRGTGHAVLCVKEQLGSFQGPVVVLYGDSPLITPQTIQNLVSFNKEHHNACSVISMTPPNCAGYGRLTFENDQISQIIEDKDCTPQQREQLTECNSGVYCFCGGRLSQHIDELTCENAQHEYYLTDMIGLYRKLKQPVAALHIEDYREVLGVNSRIQLAQVTKIMQMHINERLMEQGVSMLDPHQVWVGPEVCIGQDCELLPQTFLWGSTHIGSDCVIGPQSRLTNATVGNECIVDETVIVDSCIDDGVVCGPRAYIRGNAHLKHNAKAGTHVEIKGSEIGERSKVPHLSYIGDARLGSDVNIGGGSITCNYDGKHKSHTEIGNHVFIGSDTMMVAPVTIGDNALIGASSCITKDVPAGSLAIERSSQLIKKDWANQYWDKLKKED